MADAPKPKQELTFFEQIADEMVVLNDDEKKALAEFKKEGMKEEAKGLPITAPKIEMLHQGAAAFKFVEEQDENLQIKKSFLGIVLHIQPQRAWWKAALGEAGKDGAAANQMPDCHSDDLVVPKAESAEKQSERCDSCQWNQFGSDRKGGRGKDCKEARRMFLMVEGKLDPHVMTVPATSLKNMKKYFTFLAEKNLGRPQFVLTKFSVATTENKDQIKYSELVMTFVKPLDERVALMAMQSKRGIEEMLKTAAPMSKSEYGVRDPGQEG